MQQFHCCPLHWPIYLPDSQLAHCIRHPQLFKVLLYFLVNVFSQGILFEWVFSYGYSRISYLEFVVVTLWYCLNLNNWMSTNLCEDCGKSACWWYQVGLGSQVSVQCEWVFSGGTARSLALCEHIPRSLPGGVCLLYSIPLRRRTLSPSDHDHENYVQYSCPAVVLIHLRWQYIWLHGTTVQPMIYFLRTEVSISKQIRVLFYKSSKRLIVLKCRTLPPRRTILKLIFASSSKP